MQISHDAVDVMARGVTKGSKGGTIPWVLSHCEGAKSLWAALKIPNNVTSTFFNAVHLLPKDLRF